MRPECGVELVLHHAGLGTHPAFLGIDLQNAVHVPRQVHHQPVSERLAVGARGARTVVGCVAGLGRLYVVGQQVMAGGRSATAATTGGEAKRHQQGTRREKSGHARGRGNGSMSKGERRNFHGDEQCLEKAVLYRGKG